jgi:large subunit ribosomal protein L22
MEIKAKGRYLKISPKKMRLVVDLIRGMEAEKALNYLNFIPQKAALLIAKVLKSCIANAENNFDLKKDNLLIKKIFVNEGTVLKRWQPKAFGRATPIKKKNCHLEIVLEEKNPSSKKATKPLKEKKASEKIIQTENNNQGKEEINIPIKETQRTQETIEKKQKIDKVKARAKGTKGILTRVFRRKSI